jgi:glycosyltransferase involved in cell wall biosynthesis
VKRTGKDISVVIPTLNNPTGAILVVNKLSAIFEAQKINAEILLVDDASNSNNRTNLIAELDQYNQSARIKLILLSTRCGQFESTRYGISLCEGQFILTLDDDKMIAEKSLTDLMGTIQNSNLDFIVGKNILEKKDNTLRYIGSALIQKIGKYVYKTPKDHIFSSTILFRAESILDIARSGQYATRAGWFYQVSTLYANQDIKLTDNVRKSNYNMLSLTKSFLSVFKLLNQNFYVVLTKISIPIMLVLLAFTTIYTKSISAAPPGYFSLFLLSVTTITLLLLLNFQLSTLVKKQISIRENLISYRILKF